MTIKIGIMGYGNLGRGVECAILHNPDLELKAVFTRRDPQSLSLLTDGVKAYPATAAPSMKDEVDVMILCGGSATDLPQQTPELAQYFNVVDSFDTHANIPQHFDAVDKSARQSRHIGIISVGWDPGMFSLNRLYASAILPYGKDYTFWGKGVSQGHSDAIRRIEGVKDARQYTIPVEHALEAVRSGSNPYGEWRAEQEGRPTYLSLIKADVDTAIRQSMTERQFFYHLRQMGYDIKVGKDITLRAPGRDNGRKLMRNFGEDYSMENIRKRLLAQHRPQREYRPPPKRCWLHGDLKQAKKVTGFRALYFHYCYLLGVFPKKQNRPPKRVPHALREDLIRAQELTDEARLLSHHRIDTLEQLNAYQSDVRSQLADITEQRKSLYRKLRTKAVLADPARQEAIRAEIAVLSARLKGLRREVKLCEDIAQRSVSIRGKIQAAREEACGKEENARQEQERRTAPGRR